MGWPDPVALDVFAFHIGTADFLYIFEEAFFHKSCEIAKFCFFIRKTSFSWKLGFFGVGRKNVFFVTKSIIFGAKHDMQMMLFLTEFFVFPMEKYTFCEFKRMAFLMFFRFSGMLRGLWRAFFRFKKYTLESQGLFCFRVFVRCCHFLVF